MPLLLLMLVLLWPPRATAQDEPSPMSFEDLELLEVPAPGREAVRAKRKAAIDFSEDLIAGEAAEPQKREIRLRLAHLYHELGRDERDPEALQRAIDLYLEVLDALPGDTLRDHVTFFLGFALRSAGQHLAARATLERVIDDFPGSTYVPHAWLHLGESGFADARYGDALFAYEQAAAHEGFELRAFAFYKVAWSLERTGDPAGARSAMGRVVLDPERPALAAAAFEVLDFWSRRDLGRPAEPHFAAAVVQARLAAPTATNAPCLRGLPDLKARIAGAPLAVEAPSLQLAVVRCLAEQGQRGRAFGELRRMEHTYGRGSRWAEANDRPARRAARRQIRLARGVCA